MFCLTKWYLDLVTDEGAALIAYAASLEWAGVRVQFASTLLSRAGRIPIEATAWSQVVLPVLDGKTIRFDHDALHLSGEWQREAAPIEANLLDDNAGRLHWDCLMPSAAATVILDGETLTGRGYAERLTMTRLPWALPFSHLRWGRFLSPSRALVWIDWSGGTSHRWVWLDGIPEPNALLDEAGVRNLSAGCTLRFTSGRELCDRRALQVISRHLPSLDTLLVGPVRNLRERKRLDRGTLDRDGAPSEEGWAIHEVVSW